MKVLHSICPQIWKTQQWPQDWKISVFIPIPKKGNAKECSNYRTIALISHAIKGMHKILQGRLQQYVNHELPHVQTGFRKGRGTRDQIATICWIIEKAREFQKTFISALLTMPKPLTVWITHNKMWEILKEMGIPDHLTCLFLLPWTWCISSRRLQQSTATAQTQTCLTLRNLYAGQEVTVRTGHETTDWFQIGKG